LLLGAFEDPFVLDPLHPRSFPKSKQQLEKSLQEVSKIELQCSKTSRELFSPVTYYAGLLMPDLGELR
jgi:hypothetical protein